MRVGILGAGQLGQMLALAGYPLGQRFVFLDTTGTPSADIGQTLIDKNTSRLDEFLSQVDLLRAGQLSNKQRFALLAAFIVFANLIGLAFIGMEHNLQLLLVLGVLHGLVIFINISCIIVFIRIAPSMFWCVALSLPS